VPVSDSAISSVQKNSNFSERIWSKNQRRNERQNFVAKAFYCGENSTGALFLRNYNK
jgi:hypothetical protein